LSTEKTIWTVVDIIRWGTEYFGGKGVDSPRLTIELILSETLQCTRLQLYLMHDRPLTQAELSILRDSCKRRGNREPLQYILGKTGFYGMEFTVNPSVLIPRPETETLIDTVLQYCQSNDGEMIIHDFGTGSGCIAIALAKHLPGSTVCAVDISEKALEVARGNARNHQLDTRVEFLCGSLLGPVVGMELFDAIVSNPPYIPATEIEELEIGVKKYEPRSALDGGPEGLDVISKIIKQAPASLKNGGHLLIEVGAGQAETVGNLIKDTVGLELLPTISDGSQIQRVVHARKNS